jgi:two-component system cell cycle sensor histidine kinase/response regulator CckA
MSSSQSGRTILVVEDDAPTRVIIHRVLQEHGFIVMEANDGDQAIRVAERDLESIDLIVCDLILPNTVGTLVAKRLTALKPELKILFISGMADVSMYGVAANNYLRKPFNAPELLQKIHELLDEPQTP